MNKISARKTKLSARALLSLLLAALIITFAGCAKKQVVPPDMGLATKINWDEESPQSVLNRLRLSQKRIKYITAFFSNLNGVLYLNRESESPRVRITALGVFGRVLFDLLYSADEVAIYVPSQKTLYKGGSNQNNEGDSPFGKVFESLLIDLSHMQPQKNASLVIQKNDVLLPVDGGELLLDKMTGLIMHFRNSRREIVYKGYQAIAGKPPLPIVIELTDFEEKRKARCALSEVNFDDNTASFTLEDYQPHTVKDLSELESPAAN